MTTTHIDKEARARLLNLYDAFAPTCASPQLKTLLVAILDTLTPLPADVESSPKPEGLKWGCKLKKWNAAHGYYIESASGTTTLCPTLNNGWMPKSDRGNPQEYWSTEAGAIDNLNACTTPPPDWQPHSSVTSPSTSHDNGKGVGDDKPEAGEQRVKDLIREVWRLRSALASVEGCQHTERTDAEKIMQMKAIAGDALNLDPAGICPPQPAEPKMMPCDHSYMGRPSLCGKCGAWNPLQQSEVPSPQPSEQAKGAEPSDMAKRLTNKLWLNHLGMDVIRNYALEIDAAFAAEMESVRKGASR